MLPVPDTISAVVAPSDSETRERMAAKSSFSTSPPLTPPPSESGESKASGLYGILTVRKLSENSNAPGP